MKTARLYTNKRTKTEMRNLYFVNIRLQKMEMGNFARALKRACPNFCYCFLVLEKCYFYLFMNRKNIFPVIVYLNPFQINPGSVPDDLVSDLEGFSLAKFKIYNFF